MSEADPPAPAGSAFRGASYLLVLVLTVQLALWGAFLVPFRVGGTLVPVSCLVALLGNLLVGYAGGRLAGRAGAAFPGLLWLVVAFTLGSTRAEGDLVVPGSTVGLAFLLVGAVASAGAYALVATRRTTPG